MVARATSGQHHKGRWATSQGTLGNTTRDAGQQHGEEGDFRSSARALYSTTLRDYPAVGETLFGELTNKQKVSCAVLSGHALCSHYGDVCAWASRLGPTNDGRGKRIAAERRAPLKKATGGSARSCGRRRWRGT
jgi:hypothetical protein